MTRRLVLLGGGHAHVEVLRDLVVRGDTRWDVTLVTPYPWLTYSGMVPGLVAGHYELDDCTVDLARLAALASATVHLTTALHVDPAARQVACASGVTLPYDVLSVNVGSVPVMGPVEGVERHAILVRPLEKLVKGFNDVLVRATDGRMAAVTVVGGGAAGVEIAMAMRHRFQRDLFEVSPHVRVLADTPSITPGLPLSARAALRARMRRLGVEVQVGSPVSEVGDGFVRLRNGLEFATDAVFWTTGAAAPPWLRESGFATDQHGFLLTTDLMQSPSHPEVFGAGDCVNELGHPLPKAGVFAVRAGPVLAHNLVAALEGRPLQPWLPRKRHLQIIGTGERHAVAVYDGFSLSGASMWMWKSRIDRAWVARYRDVPLARA